MCSLSLCSHLSGHSYKQARACYVFQPQTCDLGAVLCLGCELAAVKVKHSVAIRVISSSEDLQFVSTRRVLHYLLKICNSCYVVVDIRVSIPCTAWCAFQAEN